jgi:hypothetical protein
LKVVNTEGPVAESELFKRVRIAWGLAKTGRRMQELLAGLLEGKVAKTEDGTSFYWPEGVDPNTWEQFRIPKAEDGAKRPVDDICLEELGNIAMFILSEHGRTSAPDLAKSICTLLGIQRATAVAEERVCRALRHGRIGQRVVVDQQTKLVQIL